MSSSSIGGSSGAAALSALSLIGTKGTYRIGATETCISFNRSDATRTSFSTSNPSRAACSSASPCGAAPRSVNATLPKGRTPLRSPPNNSRLIIFQGMDKNFILVGFTQKHVKVLPRKTHGSLLVSNDFAWRHT
jgi:hypothetical protein